MPIIATIKLETLRCHRRDSKDTGKPYIWPVLSAIRITSGGGGVATGGIPIGFERSIIKSGIGPGETAPIPEVLATRSSSFDGSALRQAMLLVVALLYENGTPASAIQKGSRAFADELENQITLAKVLEINNALQAEDDVELDRLIKGIRDAVEPKVRSAIRSELGLGDVLGSQDEILGFDFYLGEVSGPVQTPLTLYFQSDDHARFDPHHADATSWTRPKRIAAGLAAVPGGPVTVARSWGALPDGKHPRFALFATDSSGVVHTAVGDPKNGLLGLWAPASGGFAGTPGAPVTAVPWGARSALFATDVNGVVHTAAGDPQEGLLDVWAPLSGGFVGVPGAPVTVVPWGSRFALFATDANGVVHTAGGDPNGLMDVWAPVSGGFVGRPGAPVTVVPWNSRFALFATDVNGVVHTAGGDPNGLMGAWAPVSAGLVAAPGAPVTALPWGPRFALFAAASDGAVMTAAGDPQNDLMGPWASVSEGRTMPGARIAAVPYEDRFALFVSDPSGGIYTLGGNPQEAGSWSYVPGISATPGAPLVAVPFGDGFAVFVTDSQGLVRTTSSRFAQYSIVGTFDTRDT